MNIVCWNCNMAFRKKAEVALQLKPDIMVVPECEHPSRQLFREIESEPNDRLWIGQNETKGLGLFSYSDYKFQLFENYNPEFKYVLPVKVTGAMECNLFAVWAMNDKMNRRNRYIRQVWNALHYYSDEINDKTIIMGDFNSNRIWDRAKPSFPGNHSDVVNLLSRKKIYSVYHHFYNEEQGKETRGTLFFYRKKDRPYHIDYCFAAETYIKALENVEIGNYDDWVSHSDHMPVSIKINESLIET